MPRKLNDWIFFCDHCSISSKDKKLFVRHLKLHAAQRTRSTKKCSEEDRESDMREHLEGFGSVHTCTICSKTFKYRIQLKYHSKTHSEIIDLTEEDPNEESQEVLQSNDELLELKNRTEQTQSTVITESGHQIRYMIQGTTGRGNCEENRCHICGKYLSTKSGLNVHLKSIHSDSRPYSCNFCQKAFKTKPHLKIHQIVHSESYQYKCDVCQKAFKSKQALRIHQTVHSSVRLYHCKNCHKTFKTMHCLKSHQIVHSESYQFKCNICEKSFKRRSQLRKHQMAHSGSGCHS